MVAKRKGQKGQSMLEFALLLPLITGMFMLVIQVQMAISTAIVNQKYARGQLYFLFFNNRYYPEYFFIRKTDQSVMGQLWVGVSSINHFGDDNPFPSAPTVKVGRFKPPEDENIHSEFTGDSEGQPKRQNIHVRILSFTCVPPLGRNVNAFFTEGSLEEATFEGGFQYCRN